MRTYKHDPLEQDLGPVAEPDYAAVSFDLYDDLFPTPTSDSNSF